MKTKPSALRRAREPGFTLIELTIVIMLIGFIMGYAGLKISERFAESQVNSTKIQMKSLGTVLDDFRRVCGFYPLTEQGLEALLKKPGGRDCKSYPPEGFLKGSTTPKDAWGNDFLYESPNGQKYVIKSLGADQTEGGEGVDKDLTSDEI